MWRADVGVGPSAENRAGGRGMEEGGERGTGGTVSARERGRVA